MAYKGHIIKILLGGARMGDSLIVKSKVKDYVKDMNVSGDFADALSKVCEDLIAKACERAAANGRKTIQARDL